MKRETMHQIGHASFVPFPLPTDAFLVKPTRRLVKAKVVKKRVKRAR